MASRPRCSKLLMVAKLLTAPQSCLMRVRGGNSVLPGMNDRSNNGVDSHPVFDLRKNDGAAAAHGMGVTLHTPQIGPDSLRQIRFVDDEQVGLGDAGAAFARNLITAGNINDVGAEVGQLAAEMGGKIIAARLDEKQVGLKTAMEFLQGDQVCGDVFTDGGVRAPAGLHGADALGCQGLMPDEELSIFLGENVGGDGGDAHFVAQPQTEGQHEGGLAAADRPAHAHGKGAPVQVPLEGLCAVMKVSRAVEVFVGVAVCSRWMEMG